MRWLHGNRQGEPVVDAQFHGHREVISFLDMVQGMAIRDMRRKKNVPLARIRQGVRYLRDHHPEIEYPFARQHQTYIIEGSRDIAILLPGDDLDNVLQVSGYHRGQYVHAKMLDKYLQRLDFGQDGLASRFVPLRRGHRRVVLDPEVRFGQPRVEPAGYLVETLATACKREGSAAKAAWWYEVDKADVALAVEYHQNLTSGGPVHAKAS